MADVKNSYAALMADIVESRQIPPGLRSATQKRLAVLIDLLNELFSAGLEKELVISGGDETQGLFTGCSEAYAAGRLLQIGLYPILVRVGIGMGAWELRVPQAPSTSQDGSAYHRARRAIDELKEEQNDTGPCLASENKDCAFVANALAQNVFAWTRDQTEAQREISLIYEVGNLLGGLSPDDSFLAGFDTFIQQARLWRHQFIDERGMFSDVLAYAQILPPRLRKASFTHTAFGKQELYTGQSTVSLAPVFSLAWLADMIGGNRSVTLQAVSQRKRAGHIDQVTSLDAAWIRLYDSASEEALCNCS